ncbi:DUF309 domain-containing protein [Paenibacillus sp. J5C_2022]|uniref:DUF309 domain-containing protein n=1 Tax=Paenibacillus sp. J5C2022 TaxID=2977129 RepID=UPI0021D0D157|nr:DUF309 domain-containing protein [Paenibacillus sp. J5C2022]MCU6708237.1 DUF309 domain-containing protein [Paenibacillus sp. J5C2022]
MNHYPQSYIAYLTEFHATRDYFECHELLEEYWKAHPDDGRSELWVGLIQLAVGQYHERRGNLRGAVKMYESAYRKLDNDDIRLLGLERASLLARLMQRIAAAAEPDSPFEDMNLPIEDNELYNQCLVHSSGLGVEWGAPSRMEDESLIDRHRLRDRTDVIRARTEALREQRERRERGL